MAPKILDSVQEFLAKLAGKSNTSDLPVKGVYNNVEVWVHYKCNYYAIISYSEKPEKMFSISLNELK